MVVDEMSKGYSLGGFAGLILVNRSTINEWMRAHPEFNEAVLIGKAARLRQWETAADGPRVAALGGKGGLHRSP